MPNAIGDATVAHLLGGLNSEQRRAVSAPDGPLLVLAGAGTGKTRVLTHRIAYLVATGRTGPDHILALTFTNKAAKVMAQRVEGLLGGGLQGMWLGTFHSTSARMLRERGQLIGVPRDFVIYDEADRKSVIREVMKAGNLNEKQISPSAVAAEISRAKNEMLRPKVYADVAEGMLQTTVAYVWPEYESRLASARALDFDDLLLRAVQLLQDSKPARAHYQEKFTHVLVDEYQDTNQPQYLILQSLVAEHRRITVVGDPDQAIYGWRGADIKNILHFQEDFPGAVTVPLEQNYRSTKRILAGAQAVIRENSERLDKDLWSAGEDGAHVSVVRCWDERSEAAFVEAEIGRLVRRGVGFGDFAILYRTNAQSRALEELFMRRQVPYRLIGGIRFYQRREVKDALAYLRLLLNTADTVSFQRVVNVPKRGVGPQSVSDLMKAAETAGRPFWDLLERPQSYGIRSGAATQLQFFKLTMEALAQEAVGLPLGELMMMVLEKTGYLASLRDGTPEGEERFENVRELQGVAAEFGATASVEALPAFLEQVALAGEVDDMRDDAQAVTLITMHQVKGMEFPTVFVTGVEDGLLPHNRSMDTDSEIEEERRLLYVGMTRAKERLYLSHCQQRHLYGAPARARRSRFLAPLGWLEGVSDLDLVEQEAGYQ
ncbi:MAG: ATP-dependent helicase [Candidatus Dormibacteria bacterium]